MGVWCTTAKNSMLDALTISYISLHTGDPGETGINEVTNAGVYDREAATINTAASGSRALDADVTLQVPAATTITYVGYWSAETGGTFHGSDDVTSEEFTDAGEYKVTASGTTLAITD